MSSLLENIDQLSTDSDDEEYIPEGISWMQAPPLSLSLPPLRWDNNN